jgi:hypothetical protein
MSLKELLLIKENSEIFLILRDSPLLKDKTHRRQCKIFFVIKITCKRTAKYLFEAPSTPRKTGLRRVN